MTRVAAAGRRVARAVTGPAWVRTGFRKLGRRGLVPRGIWQRLPVQPTVDAQLPTGERFLWTGPQWAARGLYWVGIVDEPETFRVWSDLVRSAKHVIDVGANLGLYTLVACALNAESSVIAFEPVHAAAAQLERNIAANGWEWRCTVHEVALGDRSGEAEFHRRGDFDPMGSLDPAGFRGKPGQVVTVPIATLDEMIPAGTRVDVVKIDVEKFDDAVLRGMLRILHEDRPAIVVECLHDGPYRAVEAILRDAQYRLFHIVDDGPVPVERIRPDPTEQFRNFLALG